MQLLLNSKPTINSIVEKSIAIFGDQVNASLAILLSGDKGYSWQQIIDAIDKGSISLNGGISGVYPQGEPADIIIYKNTPSVKVDPDELRRIISDYKSLNILERILQSVCNGYSGDQLIWVLSFSAGHLLSRQDKSRLITCPLPKDHDYHSEYCNNDNFLIPANLPKNTPFRDCNLYSIPSSLLPPNIEGVWQGGGSLVTICRKNHYIYTYSGTNGLYKHDGTIDWWSDKKWYQGRVDDDPNLCCGNYGYVYIRKLELMPGSLDTKSTWYTPEGNLLKEVDWLFITYVRDLTADDCPK